MSSQNRQAAPTALLDVHEVTGRQGVLALQPLLRTLAAKTGQTGTMDWLHHFVSSPDSLAKRPYLFLVGDDRKLVGALLLYEYRFGGLGTRVFATDDVLGTRTVIAAEGDRIPVAAAVIQQLMFSGAVAALISVDVQSAPEPEQIHPAGRYTLQARLRTAPRYLQLQSTIEATLARMGDDTRRNFRRYRRRAQTELGAEFVADAVLSPQEFFELNRQSINPSAGDVVSWRGELVQQKPSDPRILLCGIRDREGRWLSMVGGRRNGTTAEIDWQLNRSGLRSYSLCTAMRAFLMESEIARGTKRLVFEGGTPHPMRFAFTTAQTVDLLAVRRRSLRARLLRAFADRVFPPTNFLRGALKDFSSDPPQKDSCTEVDLADAA